MIRLICLLLFLIPLSVTSQVNNYTATSGEIIFSMAEVDAGEAEMNKVLRFSPVFNQQYQFHFDFTDAVGAYSGIANRNVGFISKTENGSTIKERSYALGIPLAIKLGKLSEFKYFSVGGEVELNYAWKRKIFIDGDKTKYHEWFSDEVNLITASLFAELKLFRRQVIRFKYYPVDFLQNSAPGLVLPDGESFPDYTKGSNILYVSLAALLIKEKKRSEEPQPASTQIF